MYWILLILIGLLLLIGGKKTCESMDIMGRRYLNRSDIWTNVLRGHGRSMACSIFPQTYVLPLDLDQFNSEYSRKKEYIYKTLASGERKGVFLYEEGDDLSDSAVIQEYIQNPLLINGFKFDIRCFLVVDCARGAYLYRPFYAVYTEKPFEYHSKDRKKKINQVGQTDEHYRDNGLPNTDDALRAEGINVDKTMQELAEKLSIIMEATPQLCGKNDSARRQVYGIDAEMLADGSVKVIEINSRPQLTFESLWKSHITDPVKKYRDKGVMNPGMWIKIM